MHRTPVVAALLLASIDLTGRARVDLNGSSVVDEGLEEREVLVGFLLSHLW